MKHGERERRKLTSISIYLSWYKYVQLHTRTFKDTHIFLAKDFHDFITEAMLGLAAPRYRTDSRVSLDLWILPGSTSWETRGSSRCSDMALELSRSWKGWGSQASLNSYWHAGRMSKPNVRTHLHCAIGWIWLALSLLNICTTILEWQEWLED